MATIKYKDIVEFQDIPSSLCKKLFDGEPTEEGGCMVGIEVDSNKPGQAKLTEIEFQEGLKE